MNGKSPSLLSLAESPRVIYCKCVRTIPLTGHDCPPTGKSIYNVHISQNIYLHRTFILLVLDLQHTYVVTLIYYVFQLHGLSFAAVETIPIDFLWTHEDPWSLKESLWCVCLLKSLILQQKWIFACLAVCSVWTV